MSGASNSGRCGTVANPCGDPSYCSRNDTCWRSEEARHPASPSEVDVFTPAQEARIREIVEVARERAVQDIVDQMVDIVTPLRFGL